MLTKEQLETDLKNAMRSGDDLRKRTLRMLLSSIKLAEVEARRALDEPELLGIIQKEVKSRTESIEEARLYQREDLAKATQDEVDVLQGYLPEALTEEELKQLAQEVIHRVGANSPGAMGRVMKELVPQLHGRADGVGPVSSVGPLAPRGGHAAHAAQGQSGRGSQHAVGG
ncbi:MAG: GatB/YqeY domain-containing protein [Anaerolineales bacterium]